MAEHRGAFEYDWRTRFHLPLRSVGRGMSWGEALRLTRRLVSDPSSAVGADLAGWSYAASRDLLVLMDLFDLTHAVNSKKPTPYPRPWPVEDDRSGRTKPDASITQDEIVAALRRAGHTAALPVG